MGLGGRHRPSAQPSYCCGVIGYHNQGFEHAYQYSVFRRVSIETSHVHLVRHASPFVCSGSPSHATHADHALHAGEMKNGWMGEAQGAQKDECLERGWCLDRRKGHIQHTHNHMRTGTLLGSAPLPPFFPLRVDKLVCIYWLPECSECAAKMEVGSPIALTRERQSPSVSGPVRLARVHGSMDSPYSPCHSRRVGRGSPNVNI